MLEDLFQSSTLVSLLVATVGLLVLQLLYSSCSSKDKEREPPGPKPLPLLEDKKCLDNLVYSVMNLFAAGTDTVGNTLQWCLLFMATYPHFQGGAQQGGWKPSGPSRGQDRKNLPYTDAVIHESQRLANISPVPHKTSRNVTFQGYSIKEGTTVFPLFTSVLYDESEWETPNTFNPSHFLDKEGTFIR